MKKHTGAASFYIVTIATLLLSIIVMSFAMIALSESNRTTDSDLSQSAYDSALAGIEDAKVAILNYQSCLNQGYSAASSITKDGNTTCEEIIYIMEHPDCDMVGHILNRIPENESGEVLVQESVTNKNNMEQAYTCVKISNTVNEYRGTLSSAQASRIVPLKVDNADQIKSIKISWLSDTDTTNFKYNNILSTTGAVKFPTLTSSQIATPPTISVQLIQTAMTFNLDSFDVSRVDSNGKTGTTNRGTLYFVPSNKKKAKHDYYNSSAQVITKEEDASYYDITSDNILLNNDSINFVTSNDKTSRNVPITVYCPENSGQEFACSTSIEVPRPVVGPDGSTARSPETFMLVLSLPYGQPDTDFAVEVCTDSSCTSIDAAAEKTEGNNSVAFKDAQISIDSTGRANDLYRRIETRIEEYDEYFPVTMYALTLTGADNTIVKTIETTAEHSAADYINH